MTQTGRQVYLTKELLAERPEYRDIKLPEDTAEQRRLLRSLMNVRPPRRLGDALLAVQDDYLREELARRSVTDLADLTPIAEGLSMNLRADDTFVQDEGWYAAV